MGGNFLFYLIFPIVILFLLAFYEDFHDKEDGGKHE